MTRTNVTDPTVDAGVLDAAGLRRVVAVLSLTQIVGYGVLYYAFTVLNAAIVADTGWSLVWTTMAFSLSQIVAAVVGIQVGRSLDARGPRRVMTGGSVLAVSAVALIAASPNQVWFLAGWLVAGFAMSAVFYTPAFSAITHWGGSRALSGVTTVTLVAGFASTVFGPLTAQLEQHVGWRGSYLVLAALLGMVTVPAHWFGLRGRWVPRSAVRDMTGSPSARVKRPFIMLGIAMSLAALAEYGVLVQLVPLLVSRGLDTTDAATVLGIGGAGQVGGRLCYGWLTRHTSVVQRTVTMFALLCVTSALFPVLPSHLGWLVAGSVLAGFARGCVTLLQATAVADRWGVVGIGRRNGLVSAPVLVAAALAPFVAAVLESSLGGQAGVFYLLAVAAFVAALLVPFTMPRAGSVSPPLLSADLGCRSDRRS
jgi:MFS family permease